MSRMKNILPFCALLTALSSPALAAGDDGGFGESFTATAPAALADDDALADYSGESLSVIEPAAGEQIWISPDEDAATVETPSSDLLSSPDHVLVPGMEAPTGTNEATE